MYKLVHYVKRQLWMIIFYQSTQIELSDNNSTMKMYNETYHFKKRVCV